MAKHKQYRSEKFKKRKKKKKIIKYSIFLTLIIFLLIAAGFISCHKSLTVETVEISSNKYLDNELIIDKVNNTLSGRYFFLFSKRNFLILPRAEIRENVLFGNIFISNVELELDGPNRLLINVIEHNPVVKWCDENNSCYLVNKDGLIYIKDEFLDMSKTGNTNSDNLNVWQKNENENLVTMHGMHSDTEDVVGRYYLETDLFSSIMSILDYLKDIDFAASYLSTDDGETFSIYFKNKPYLMVSKYSNAKEVVQNLKTTIETEELNSAQLENLEYIDLRFGNKVYYKIK